MTTVKEWHIWDFPDTIHVKFSDGFRIKLFKLLVAKFGSRNKASKALGCHTTNLRSYLQLGHDSGGFQAFTPMRIVKKISAVLGDSLKVEIERNVVAYRAWGGNSVRSPILPIKETPEMYSIVAHLICDGTAGKGKTPAYYNIAKELLDEVEEYVKVFGEVKTLRYRVQSNVYALLFPKAISDVLSHIFEIPFVRTQNLPKLLFEAPKECQLAALRAIFDDEGSIRESGQIVVVNKPIGIIEDVKTILKQNGMESGVITFAGGCHSLSVLSISRENFIRNVGFTHKVKKNRSDEILERDRKFKARIKLEDKIYNLLVEKQPLDRFEMARQLNTSINSITDVLYNKLRSQGRVTSKFNGKNKSYLWHVQGR